MEARVLKTALPAAARRFALLAVVLLVSMGARQRSANFIVETPDPAFARQVSQAAEKYRHDLAVEWLGRAMPDWAQPCVMTVQAAPNLGNGGQTSFQFQNGEVFGWRMSIQGSRERILDSVLPHEITHMIFASHFRQPLPRWADEGGATNVEHQSEKNKYLQRLYVYLRTGYGISFNRMFAMSDYPPGMNQMMSLYSQGYSLADYLIQTSGRRKYVEFVGDGLKSGDWAGAVRKNYGIDDLGNLQNTWLAWVKRGCPPLRSLEGRPAAPDTMIASNGRRPRPKPNLIHREPDRRSSPEAADDLEPVHIPSGQVAAGAAKELPASGWHAVGAESAGASATRTARPQPVESP
ncbi:MAG: hypothetical protein JW959_02560 [Pirellulales bacterium]|nr:hypothetical protein [Pirellulales bacterium]